MNGGSSIVITSSALRIARSASSLNPEPTEPIQRSLSASHRPSRSAPKAPEPTALPDREAADDGAQPAKCRDLPPIPVSAGPVGTPTPDAWRQHPRSPAPHERTHEVQCRGIRLGRKWQGIKGFERQSRLSKQLPRKIEIREEVAEIRPQHVDQESLAVGHLIGLRGRLHAPHDGK